MTHPQREPEVWYRFTCKHCNFQRQTRERSRDPEYCPRCSYPRNQAGHVYRDEPRDGDELDG